MQKTSKTVAKIENAEMIFVSYLNILRESDRQGFRDALSNAGYRFWTGEITADEYNGIFGELKRDVKGTAAQYGRIVDNPRRIVTMPRKVNA